MHRYTVAYIVSAPRSGSTLLDNLLASHPDVVSLGEVHHLRAYALDDRQYYNPKQPLVCTCGAKVQNCVFWSAVQREMGAPLGRLHLQSPISRELRATFSKYLQTVLRIPVALISRYPSLYRIKAVQNLFDSKRIGMDSFRLFDAVYKVSGAACIVDSSKMPFRLLSLWNQRPDQVRVIMLCRDYKAVTHSKMKRGRSLAGAISSWTRWHRDMEALSPAIKPSSIFRLTYEQLCETPDVIMKNLWEFLGLRAHETIQRQSVDTMHHLGGSPSKRDSGRREIRRDTEYVQAFTASDLEQLKKLASPYAQKWGYD
ncbi:MAG: sulfotransferase [Solirubrobacterales bacterium]